MSLFPARIGSLSQKLRIHGFEINVFVLPYFYESVKHMGLRLHMSFAAYFLKVIWYPRSVHCEKLKQILVTQPSYRVVYFVAKIDMLNDQFCSVFPRLTFSITAVRSLLDLLIFVPE